MSTHLPTQTAAGIRCQLPVALPTHTPTPTPDTNANDAPPPEASASELGEASGEEVEEALAFVHYRDLPVKDNLAGGATARLAVRLLRWVEGTPLVGL